MEQVSEQKVEQTSENDSLPSLRTDEQQQCNTETKNRATFSPISMQKNDFRTKLSPNSRPSEKFNLQISPQKRNSRSIKSAPPEKAPSQSEIESSLNAFLQDGEPIDPQMKCYVIQFLNRKKVKELVNGQYLEAKKYENIIKEINECEKSEALNAVRSVQNEALTERISELQSLYDEENKRWDQRVEMQKRENNDAMIELKERHAQEVGKFKEKWMNTEYVESRCKPSQKLLTLRYKESKLALLKEYDDADTMRALADEQQVKEEEENKKVLEEKMTKEFIRMKERHAKEEEAAIEHQKKTLEIIEIQRERALKYYQASEKPPVLSRTATAYLSSSSSQVTTPRTAKSFASLRNVKTVKLTPPRFEESTFEKLENMMNKQSNPKPKKVQKRRSSTTITRRLLPVL